jgi:hypothetical protein
MLIFTEDPEILEKIRAEVNQEYRNHFAPTFGVSPSSESCSQVRESMGCFVLLLF